jgi:hypothetical protein
MKVIQSTECPNCWGYLTYDEKNLEEQICESKN